MHETLNRADALRAISAYRSGEVGVPYAALKRFAGPIFDLYHVETSDSFETAPLEDLVDHLSVMETAHLFWWYFGSGADGDESLTARIKRLLVGANPTDDQEAVFAALVEQLRINWEITPEALRRVNGSPCSTTALSRLLDELEHGHADSAAGPEAGGNAAVDSPDALAVFASPLLEDPSIEDDPDRISELMARARDYWHLAQLEGQKFDREQIVIADRYATTSDDRQRIMAESSFMVARFHSLFPQWTGTAGDA